MSLEMYGLDAEDYYFGDPAPRDAYNAFVQSVQEDCAAWRLPHRVRFDDRYDPPFARLEVETINGWETMGTQRPAVSDGITPTAYHTFERKWRNLQAWLVRDGL